MPVLFRFKVWDGIRMKKVVGMSKTFVSPDRPKSFEFLILIVCILPDVFHRNRRVPTSHYWMSSRRTYKLLCRHRMWNWCLHHDPLMFSVVSRLKNNQVKVLLTIKTDNHWNMRPMRSTQQKRCPIWHLKIMWKKMFRLCLISKSKKFRFF